MKFYITQQNIINPLTQELLICRGATITSAMVEFLRDVFGYDALELELI